MNIRTSLLVSATLLSAAGCFTVKTESEIKPIHITMDVNLKVDKELDKAFADEDKAKPKGNFKEVKAALDRQAVGITNRAMLEARTGATDNDRILVVEENAKRAKRFEELAKSSGVSVEAKVKHGPVTTLGLTQTGEGKLKFIVSEGESTPDEIMQIGNTQTHVRFAVDPDAYMERWFMEAPTHHFAMSVGHNQGVLAKTADLLNVQSTVI